MDINDLQKFDIKSFNGINEAIKAVAKMRSGGSVNPPDYPPDSEPPAGTFDQQLANLKPKANITIDRVSVERSKQTAETQNLLPSNVWMFNNSQNPNDHTVFVQNNTTATFDYNNYFLITPASNQPKISAPWGLDSAFANGGSRNAQFRNLWNAIANNTFMTKWASMQKTSQRIFPMSAWQPPEYTPPTPEPPDIPSGGGLEGMTKSCNWRNSAKTRMMNLLSPNCSTSEFDSRLSKMKSDGCDFVNFFICNNKDTSNQSPDSNFKEYSIYGSNLDWTIDNTYVNHFKTKINRVVNTYGMKVALWLAADDDGDWNEKLANKWSTYVNDLHTCGVLQNVSCLVVGLEADEYWSSSQVNSHLGKLKELREAHSDIYKWSLGVHETGNEYSFGRLSNCEVFFFQTNVNYSTSEMKSKVKECVDALSPKPVCAFELDWDPNKTKCNAAFEAGAVSVGNWGT